MRTWKDFTRIIDMGEVIEETPRIAVMGCFQNGKSTLVNCLLDGLWALPGDGKATTSIATRYRFKNQNECYYRKKDGILKQVSIDLLLRHDKLTDLSSQSAFQAEIFLNNPFLKFIELVDTPGFNVDRKDSMIAEQSIEEIDYIVFITINTSLSEGEKQILQLITQKDIPYVVIMNCVDSGSLYKWLPSHPLNLEMAEDISSDLKQCGFTPEKIGNSSVYICNLLWYWATTEQFHQSLSFFSGRDEIMEDITFLLEKVNIAPSVKNIIVESRFEALKDFLTDRLQIFDALTERG